MYYFCQNMCFDVCLSWLLQLEIIDKLLELSDKTKNDVIHTSLCLFVWTSHQENESRGLWDVETFFPVKILSWRIVVHGKQSFWGELTIVQTDRISRLLWNVQICDWRAYINYNHSCFSYRYFVPDSSDKMN